MYEMIVLCVLIATLKIGILWFLFPGKLVAFLSSGSKVACLAESNVAQSTKAEKIEISLSHSEPLLSSTMSPVTEPNQESG